MSMKTLEPKVKSPRLPPRWFIRFFWLNHRRLYRATRGHVGLWRPKGDRWGAMCVIATGRHTGEERRVMVGYFEDRENLVTMAMNGWMPGTPAWWLNVQAHPEVEVITVDGLRKVRGRAAHGEERARLWARWSEIDQHLDQYASRRHGETAIVVFEPR